VTRIIASSNARSRIFSLFPFQNVFLVGGGISIVLSFFIRGPVRAEQAYVPVVRACEAHKARLLAEREFENERQVSFWKESLKVNLSEDYRHVRIQHPALRREYGEKPLEESLEEKTPQRNRTMWKVCARGAEDSDNEEGDLIELLEEEWDETETLLLFQHTSQPTSPNSSAVAEGLRAINALVRFGDPTNAERVRTLLSTPATVAQLVGILFADVDGDGLPDDDRDYRIGDQTSFWSINPSHIRWFECGIGAKVFSILQDALRLPPSHDVASEHTLRNVAAISPAVTAAFEHIRTIATINAQKRSEMRRGERSPKHNAQENLLILEASKLAQVILNALPHARTVVDCESAVRFKLVEHLLTLLLPKSTMLYIIHSVVEALRDECADHSSQEPRVPSTSDDGGPTVRRLFVLTDVVARYLHHCRAYRYDLLKSIDSAERTHPSITCLRAWEQDMLNTLAQHDFARRLSSALRRIPLRRELNSDSDVDDQESESSESTALARRRRLAASKTKAKTKAPPQQQKQQRHMLPYLMLDDSERLVAHAFAKMWFHRDDLLEVHAFSARQKNWNPPKLVNTLLVLTTRKVCILSVPQLRESLIVGTRVELGGFIDLANRDLNECQGTIVGLNTATGDGDAGGDEEEDLWRVRLDRKHIVAFGEFLLVPRENLRPLEYTNPPLHAWFEESGDSSRYTLPDVLHVFDYSAIRKLGHGPAWSRLYLEVRLPSVGLRRAVLSFERATSARKICTVCARRTASIQRHGARDPFSRIVRIEHDFMSHQALLKISQGSWMTHDDMDNGE
tara:strand:+ start:1064 stop:3451 length:2388 start_codon:yes stop_codon:yes gene_type:complete